MFDIGFWEMAFIGIIALVVIGPERLPGVAHRVGIWIGKSRRMLNEVMSDVKKEMKEYDIEQVKTLSDEFKSASDPLKDITQSVTDSLDLKAVGSAFKESIEEVSSISSPSAQKTDKATQTTPGKTAIKKSVPRKKTKTTIKTKPKTKTAKKTIKKTVSKRPTKKATSKSAQLTPETK